MFSSRSFTVSGLTFRFLIHFEFIFVYGVSKCSQFSSVQSLSHVRLFATPWITACQASLSITNSQSLLKLMSMESVIPSSHLILCRPLLLLPPIPPSIRAFSNESSLQMRWSKYWSFNFSISPSNEYPGLISFSFILLQVVDQFSQHHLLKRLSFLYCIFLPPLSKIRCP